MLCYVDTAGFVWELIVLIIRDVQNLLYAMGDFGNRSVV